MLGLMAVTLAVDEKYGRVDREDRDDATGPTRRYDDGNEHDRDTVGRRRPMADGGNLAANRCMALLLLLERRRRKIVRRRMR